MKSIIIEIETDGSVHMDAKGFTGNSCSLATKELEMVLAGAEGVTDDRKKPEFFQRIGSSVTQRS